MTVSTTPCPEVVYYEVGDSDYACDLPANHAGPHHWVDAFTPDDEAPSDDPYCAEHGRRFDPAVGCPGCLPNRSTTTTEGSAR